MRRTVRLLRPLRAMTRVQGMKLLVNSIIAAFPALSDVVILLSFEYFIAGTYTSAPSLRPSRAPV